MKFECEVGSLCTRFVKRKLVVSATSEEDAHQKALDKFIELEMKVASSVDAGSPQVDRCKPL